MAEYYNKVFLGIETSCDDTAIGIIKNKKILANEINTQKEHNEFGGVVPEIASRAHENKILQILQSAIKKANIKKEDIDIISVTSKPGLLPAVLVGLVFARALAYGLKKPLVEVDHVEAHLCINEMFFDITPPYLALAVSGGHTSLYEVDKEKNYIELLSTADDAIGEAFDKFGRAMGLIYPAGAEIDKLAQNGQNIYNILKNPSAKKNPILSFSGLKSAAINFLERQEIKDALKSSNRQKILQDICCSFNNLVVDSLFDKCEKYIANFSFSDTRTLSISGGVAANSFLRKKAEEIAKKYKLNLAIPPSSLCTDNGVMIAYRAYNILSNKKQMHIQ